MQGYILKTQPVRDEDLLVWILSKERLIQCYRFYGARHGAILAGFKLDFELALKPPFLPHLKGTLHLGFSWLNKREYLMLWQTFMRLIFEHLKDSSECESFYYDLLDDLVRRFEKQNPKRALLEAYLKLLDFEGRLNKNPLCFACSQSIDDDELCVLRGFLLAHLGCLGKNSFNKNKIIETFSQKSCINLDDDEINELYLIMLEGL